MRKRRFLSFIDARNGIIIPVLFYLSRKNEVAVDKYLRTELVYIYIYIIYLVLKDSKSITCLSLLIELYLWLNW
jgi:hypothetical protein